MDELDVKRVPFMGTELVAAQDKDGQIWAGVSYICNGIGLNKNEKDRQVKNVQADRVLKKGCVKFDAGVFDPNNQTVAIKLDFVPLWLAKINITPSMQAETPELAERLEAYQLRAKDVLSEAFLGGKMAFVIPQDYPSALRALASAEERRLALEAEAKANAPLVLFAKGVEGSSNSILVRDLAKILNQNGIPIGGNRLFEELRRRGYLVKQKGRGWNMPTQRAVEMGLFEVKETVVSTPSGTETRRTPLVTGKGQTYFCNLFQEWKKEA